MWNKDRAEQLYYVPCSLLLFITGPIKDKRIAWRETVNRVIQQGYIQLSKRCFTDRTWGATIYVITSATYVGRSVKPGNTNVTERIQMSHDMRTKSVCQHSEHSTSQHVLGKNVKRRMCPFFCRLNWIPPPKWDEVHIEPGWKFYWAHIRSWKRQSH